MEKGRKAAVVAAEHKDSMLMTASVIVLVDVANPK